MRRQGGERRQRGVEGLTLAWQCVRLRTHSCGPSCQGLQEEPGSGRRGKAGPVEERAGLGGPVTVTGGAAEAVPGGAGTGPGDALTGPGAVVTEYGGAVTGPGAVVTGPGSAGTWPPSWPGRRPPGRAWLFPAAGSCASSWGPRPGRARGSGGGHGKVGAPAGRPGCGWRRPGRRCPGNSGSGPPARA